MNKDIIPQNYTLALALFDAVPVILFGLGSRLLYKMCRNSFVLAGAIVCFVSGMLKVLWKILVVTKKVNVWPLFVQMRIGMSLGFVLILIGLFILRRTEAMHAFRAALLRPAPILFLILSVLCIAGMIVCGSKMDAAEAKANWIEQCFNTAAQGAFFISMLLTRRSLK